MTKKINLVLSGGGARGAIHVGIYQYLKENNYEIQEIAGTSVGSLIGCLIAADVHPQELIKVMRDSQIKDFLKPDFRSKLALFNLDKLNKVIESYIPHNSFEGLNIPFTACSTNLSKNKAQFFTSGELSDRVEASCSIPLVFSPKQIDGDLYCDGGLLNNLPVQAISDNGFPIVACHANNYKYEPIHKTGEVINRIVNISVGNTAKEGMELADVLINPFLEHSYSTLDLKDSQELFDIGYGEAQKILG
ncbi:MAG: patatin-like phospholipase family protein [Flavobacteriaceae bacterium]